MSRRDRIERYVTEKTTPTFADELSRALRGNPMGAMPDGERIDLLFRAVRALYETSCFLADELDKVEAGRA